jgi:flagellar basal body-associated protein FliL
MKINDRLTIGILIIFTLLTSLVLTSCGAASYMGAGDDSYQYDMAEEGYAPAAEYEYATSDAYDGDIDVKRINGGQVGEAAIRQVIRTGSINLAVRNTRETIQEIKDIVAQAEGLISYSYVYEMRENQYGAYLTLRIPSARFDSIMSRLEELGKSTNIQTGLDDVTMQYVDLESRLNNQKAQEARLVEILSMAETVEEVLEVERELFRVRGEIESMTAQFNMLSDQISYSTIEVSLREETIPTEVISPGAFDNFGEKIRQAFVGSINFVLNAISFIVIALIALIPVLLLIGIFVLFMVLLVKKISKRNKAKTKEPIEKAATTEETGENKE